MAGTVSLAGKAAAFTESSTAGRVALVNVATALARRFVESEDFTRRYADHREANGPDPLPEEQTADQVLAKQRAGFEQQVEGLRRQFGDITPEQRATLEQGFDTMRARFTEMETGQAKADLDTLLKGQRAQQVAAHAQATEQFAAIYPADPRALVMMRLRAFLEMTRDIDFTATLVAEAGKRRFADPGLEARPAEWKMSFRAGKPAVDAARGFAARWLADLEARGVK
jgi:hypothetical protein